MQKKVLLVIPNLGSGGSERNFVWLFQALSAHKEFQVNMLVLGHVCKKYEYLQGTSNFEMLNIGRINRSIYQLITRLRRNRNSTVISTLGHLNLLLAILKTLGFISNRLIVRESSIVSYLNAEYKYPDVWNIAYRTFYGKAEVIIAQSDYMKKDLASSYNIPLPKIVLVPNPVIMVKSKEEFVCDSNYFVYVGRLSYEKNVDLIIDSFSKINDKEVKLIIVGDGDLRGDLETLVASEGLNRRVKFLGFQDNPERYMRGAKALILASFYEGFPNVVIEALSCKTRVVAVNAPGGLNDIKKHFPEELVLVDRKKDSLSNALEEVLQDNSQYDFIGLRHYEEQEILRRYIEAL